MIKPPRYRPDMDGGHRTQYDRNKRIIFHSQEYCALCGGLVDFSRKFPDPLSPSIDHIIPVSRGGDPSALENMQLAHLGCNAAKGNRNIKSNKPSASQTMTVSHDWRTF